LLPLLSSLPPGTSQLSAQQSTLLARRPIVHCPCLAGTSESVANAAESRPEPLHGCLSSWSRARRRTHQPAPMEDGLHETVDVADMGGGLRRILLEGDMSSTILAILCLIAVYLAAMGVVCQWIDRSWVQSSTVYVLSGCMCGGLLRLEYGVYAQERLAAGLTFDDDFYFRVLLPLVVLDAGLNLERENVNFYDNFTPIMVFTIAGTFLSAMIIGFGTWGLGAMAEATWGEPLNGTLNFDDPIESLKFGALISPTDPVAILSVLGSLGPLKDPALFSIIFGESVLNDAIGIVLFEVFEELDQTREADDVWQLQVLAATGWFVVICICSVLLGVLVGLIAAKLTQMWPVGEGSTHYEVTIVFFASYGAYLLGEALNKLSDAPGPFSGIFCLFSATLVASHYTMHNISPEAKLTSNFGIKTVAWLSEAIIFFYLGVEILLAPLAGWDVGFILLVTVLGFLGRCAPRCASHPAYLFLCSSPFTFL
jgi:NhaP-type Na+/H+ or K+/H+ antiporter